MAQTSQAPEQFLDMTFPIDGVDLSRGFSDQGPATTPIGQNVRAFEPSTLRSRGGCRPGLFKYTPQVPLGSTKIQHLNVVVDPAADALVGATDDPTGNVDPSTNPPGSNPSDPNDLTVRNRGRIVRVGGNGIQPNRNRPKPKPALVITANNITKKFGDTYNFAGTEFSVTGLTGGDVVSSVQFDCTGTPSGAAVGSYPIVPHDAVGFPAAKYSVQYKNGTMSVVQFGFGILLFDYRSSYHRVNDPGKNGTTMYTDSVVFNSFIVGPLTIRTGLTSNFANAGSGPQGVLLVSDPSIPTSLFDTSATSNPLSTFNLAGNYTDLIVSQIDVANWNYPGTNEIDFSYVAGLGFRDLAPPGDEPPNVQPSMYWTSICILRLQYTSPDWVILNRAFLTAGIGSQTLDLSPKKFTLTWL